MDVDYADFEKMLGIKLHRDMEKLDEILAFVKGEVKLFDEKEGTLSIEIKDTNRPDLWGIEGLTRTLRGFLGIEEGLKRYSAGKPILDVYVDERLGKIRPYIGCSVVKGVKLTDTVIRGLMHLQDKLDQTYGRNRRRTSIGLYDYSLITPPLYYTVAKPTEISFAPLGFTEEMTLKEILEQHPKGLEYGHIVEKHALYPILLDSKRKVLSFPPIINSNDLGKVTEKTECVLVEVTGTAYETVLNTLKIVTLALVDRGGKAYSAKIHYPREKSHVLTPSFEVQYVDLHVDYVNRVLGLNLASEQIVKLLGKAGFGVKKARKEAVTVQVPCYRIDIMHPIDIVEDVAIAYGYNNIKPLWRKLPTTGGTKPEQPILNAARELMIGLGFQEVLTYTLTNPENLFKKMNCKKERIIEVANPKVQTFTCLRNWLLPSLMEFLSNNLHVDYPQKIFELGTVVLPDAKAETKTRDEERLAAVTAHASASFSEIKSALDAFLVNIGVKWEINETKHPSFIEGRVGTAEINGVNIGFLGEIHPKVLEAWKLEHPAAAFEINMTEIAKIKQCQVQQP
ncbi:MAG: phenylalanine--tRNA ligase subunit beta [Candidatus Bathyarchaeota archaeon]|nr:phenylalanine--tRNA ligase subunit beta [Candidatus Bathyarchaeota archaeon]